MVQVSGFDYTTDGLIESIKIRAMFPTTQETFTTARLLQLADEELQTVIAPIIMSIKGDYFVNNHDVVMTTASNYAIPQDAIGLKIKDVWYLDPQGQNQTLIPLINSQNAQFNWYGIPYFTGYFIQNNDIVLFPRGREGFTLRQRYFKRASKLVETSASGIIEDASTVNIVLSNIPATWEVGNLLSLIQANPGFQTLATDLEITALTPPTLQMVSTNPNNPILLESDLEGNWLALNNETPIPQITPEAHPLLAQAVAIKCLEGLADPYLQTAQGKFNQIQKAFIDMMAPRADAQAKKISHPDGGILGWSGVWPWPWWGGS